MDGDDIGLVFERVGGGHGAEGMETQLGDV